MQLSIGPQIQKAIALYLREQMEKTLFQTGLSRGIDFDIVDWDSEPIEINNLSNDKEKTTRDLQRTYKSLKLIRDKFNIR